MVFNLDSLVSTCFDAMTSSFDFLVSQSSDTMVAILQGPYDFRGKLKNVKDFPEGLSSLLLFLWLCTLIKERKGSLPFLGAGRNPLAIIWRTALATLPHPAGISQFWYAQAFFGTFILFIAMIMICKSGECTYFDKLDIEILVVYFLAYYSSVCIIIQYLRSSIRLTHPLLTLIYIVQGLQACWLAHVKLVLVWGVGSIVYGVLLASLNTCIDVLSTLLLPRLSVLAAPLASTRLGIAIADIGSGLIELAILSGESIQPLLASVDALRLRLLKPVVAFVDSLLLSVLAVPYKLLMLMYNQFSPRAQAAFNKIGSGLAELISIFVDFLAENHVEGFASTVSTTASPASTIASTTASIGFLSGHFASFIDAATYIQDLSDQDQDGS